MGRVGRPAIETRELESTSQCAVCRVIHNQQHGDLLNSGSQRERARILATSSKAARAWLKCISVSSLGTRMTNEQIRIAVAIQLGCKMYDSHSCSRCNSDAPSDSSHGLHYRRAARHHSRHSHLNNLVQRALVSARVPSVLKPLGFTRNDAKRSDGITLVP